MINFFPLLKSIELLLYFISQIDFIIFYKSLVYLLKILYGIIYSQNRINSNFLIDFSTYFSLSALVYKIHKINPQIKTIVEINILLNKRFHCELQ